MSGFSKSECLRQHYNGHNGESLNSALGNKPRKSKQTNKENNSPVWIEKHSTSSSQNFNISSKWNGNTIQSRIEKLEEQLDNMAFVVINQSKEINGLRNVLYAEPPGLDQSPQPRLPLGILESSYLNERKNSTI